MDNKFESVMEALRFVRDQGAKITGLNIEIKSGTLGLRKIGVVDFLSSKGFFIRWI